MPTRRYPLMSTSGAPCVPMGTPRRRSPGALWGCPGWPWKRSVSIYSGRRPRASGAGVLWQDNALVFTTALGTRLDAADVRRSLRRV